MLLHLVTISYKNLGCFTDRAPTRAISGGLVVFPANEVIQKCYEKAKAAGNGFFAVQYNTECFTHPTAGATYNKYGATTGCANGRGGSWKNNVYQVIDIGRFLQFHFLVL